MKKFIVPLFSALFLSMLCISAFGGVKDDMIKKETERRARLASLAEGKEFSSRGVKYVFLPELRAKKIGYSFKGVAKQAEVQRLVSASNGEELIEESGDLVFYKISASAPAIQSTDMKGKTAGSYFKNSGYPVAKSRKNGRLSAVSGGIRVKLHSFANVKAVAKSHGLLLRNAFGHIETAFFSVFADQNIVETWLKLKKDARVKEADIEVIEHFMQPM